MTERRIARFFHELACRVAWPVEVVLTGGAAARLEGGVRPTVDVDFEARARSRRGATWEALTAAIAEAGHAAGVVPHFSEDIDRWTSITLGDFRTRARVWRRFDRVTVRMLDPLDFAIGKLARGTADDLADIVVVLSRRRPSWRTAARRWGEALKASPRSSAIPLFARQVEGFLRDSGRRIWGRGFDPEAAIRTFLRAARGRASNGRSRRTMSPSL